MTDEPRFQIVLTSCPACAEVVMPAGGTAALDPAHPLRVRLGVPDPGAERWEILVHPRSPDGPEALYELGWGGRLNHLISYVSEGGWVITHAGHMLPVFVNGEPVYGDRVLREGDRVEPARGLVFTFQRAPR